MDRAPRALLFGNQWLALGHAERSWLFDVAAGQELELDGSVHRMLWECPDVLSGVLGGDDDSQSEAPFASLGRALRRGGHVPTLAELLAPSGFGRIFVELTGRCNERCLHCYASSSPEVEDALDQREIGSVIQQAHQLGFASIQFTGGDPLISKHIEFAVAEARAVGFEHVEVYTNGLALNDALAAFLAKHRVNMAFSVYSHRADVHDAVTATPGSHARTLRAIERAMKAGMWVRVSVVLREENQDDAKHVRQLVTELGVPEDAIGVDRERPVGRGHWQEGVDVPADEEEAGKAAHAPGGHGGKLSVSYTGNVVPCIFDRDTVLGSIRVQSLSEILQQPLRARAARPKASLPLAGAEQPLACGDCQTRRRTLRMAEW